MALKRHSRRPAGRQPGYALVVLSAFLFAAGGNAVKALFKLGYSPLVLAQLRIWWAFAWLLLILLTVRPALLRVKRRELPALAIFGTIGLAGVQLSYYLTIARINIAVALLVQYLGLVAVTAFERYHRRQAVPAQVWVALAIRSKFIQQPPSQAGLGNDIHAGSPGLQKAPTRGPASLVAIRALIGASLFPHHQVIDMAPKLV